MVDGRTIKSPGEVVAIIPARGGSKGIPGKNMRKVAGEPLVQRSIEAALGARTVSRVVVSTDDPAIAHLARVCGAQVVLRPEHLSGDTAKSEDALLHVLHQLREQEGYAADRIVFLQCTSPLTLSRDIDGAVLFLEESGADSLFSAAPFRGFVWRGGSGGAAQAVNHDSTGRLRRQDLSAQYLENGALYVFRADGFMKSGHRFFGRTVIYPMPRERSVEVDDPADLLVAEALAAGEASSVAADWLPEFVRAVVFDFDGVFTDNGVMVFEDGSEAVVCNRGDGLGIGKLAELGIAVLVISKERNTVVSARCAKLGIPCLQAVDDKRAALTDWLREKAIRPEEAIFVGNDVNDVECMSMVGCGIAVADAHQKARSAARIVLSQPGGKGAVREVADMIERRMEKSGI